MANIGIHLYNFYLYAMDTVSTLLAITILTVTAHTSAIDPLLLSFDPSYGVSGTIEIPTSKTAQQNHPTPTNAVPIKASPQPANNDSTLCEGLCLPFLGNYTDKNVPFGEKTYTDQISSTTVTVNVLRGEEYRTVNLTAELYVNRILAGQIGGQAIGQDSFSPDHRYFAFRISSTCGAACQGNEVYVVDLMKPFVMFLLINPDDSGENTSHLSSEEPYVESYTWGDKSISVTTYSVAVQIGGYKAFRMHPREIWTFDLSNPQSVMRNGVVKIIPEPPPRHIPQGGGFGE